MVGIFGHKVAAGVNHRGIHSHLLKNLVYVVVGIQMTIFYLQYRTSPESAL